jgi:hypothetical protein
MTSTKNGMNKLYPLVEGALECWVLKDYILGNDKRLSVEPAGELLR